MKRFILISVRLLTLLFLAGNTLLLILIIISGSTNSSPINEFFWVEGDTSGIANAGNVTRWTFWGACSAVDGNNVCGSDLSPAYPISPVDNFHTKENVPQKFISDRDTFYYLTRFSFSFFWVALAFIGITFLLYIVSWWSLEFTKVVFCLLVFGMLFDVAAVCLQTAATVMAKNAFTDDDRHAKLGSKMLGMAWATVFLSMAEFAVCTLDFVKVFTTASRGAVGRSDYYNNNNSMFNAPRSNSTKGYFKDLFSGKANVPALVVDESSAAVNYEAMDTATAATAAQQPADPPQRRGIDFFTIRNANKVHRDDDSV